jgi:murein DD-endopeptidase MepM/ murein hydrolase activator NlpD
MKFFRSILSKNTFSFLHLSKEVFIAVTLILFQAFFPNTVEAGIFSVIYGDKAAAQSQIAQNVPNSQNMAVLKAVVNSNPSPSLNDHTILASENALVAEIGPAGTASEIDDLTTSTEISIYVVRKGDTLSEIAEMFNVSVNTIVWANDISRNTALKEGQTLIILPVTGIRHTVKKGDTIQTIVKKYKGDLDEVLEFNDLSINTPLKVGQTIIIPDAEMTSVQRPSGNATTPSYANYYMRPITGGRKSQGLHGHNGVDLAAPVGTPIYASAGGTVIASISNGGWNGGYGNYIIISHPNGTQTLYSHNQTNFVKVGDKVNKGDLIGKIGMTGKTTGPHIHFEIRGAKNPF